MWFCVSRWLWQGVFLSWSVWSFEEANCCGWVSSNRWLESPVILGQVSRRDVMTLFVTSYASPTYDVTHWKCVICDVPSENRSACQNRNRSWFMISRHPEELHLVQERPAPLLASWSTNHDVAWWEITCYCDVIIRGAPNQMQSSTDIKTAHCKYTCTKTALHLLQFCKYKVTCTWIHLQIDVQIKCKNKHSCKFTPVFMLWSFWPFSRQF